MIALMHQRQSHFPAGVWTGSTRRLGRSWPLLRSTPTYQVNLVVTAFTPNTAFALLNGFGDAKYLMYHSQVAMFKALTELDDDGTPLEILCESGCSVEVGLTHADSNVAFSLD